MEICACLQRNPNDLPRLQLTAKNLQLYHVEAVIIRILFALNHAEA
jgi:hypothetical protein